MDIRTTSFGTMQTLLKDDGNIISEFLTFEKQEEAMLMIYGKSAISLKEKVSFS